MQGKGELIDNMCSVVMLCSTFGTPKGDITISRATE